MMEDKLRHKFKDFEVRPSPSTWEKIAGELNTGMVKGFRKKFQIVRNLLVLTTATSITLGILLIKEKVDQESAISTPFKNDNNQLLSEISKDDNNVNNENSFTSENNHPVFPGQKQMTPHSQDMNISEPDQSHIQVGRGRKTENIPLKNTMLQILDMGRGFTNTGNKNEEYKEFFEVSKVGIQDIAGIDQVANSDLNPYPSLIKADSSRKGLPGYVEMSYDRSFPGKNTKIDYSNKTGVIRSEELFSGQGIGMIAGISSGHWVFESGLAFNTSASKLKISLRDYENVMNTQIVQDSVGFVFNAIDSSFEIIFEERNDTFYTEEEINELIKTQRQYTSIRVPLQLGYRYSYKRTSLVLKAGLTAHLLLGSTIDHDLDIELPPGLLSDPVELFWTLHVQPEIWYFIMDKWSLKAGINYRYLADEGFRQKYPAINDNRWSYHIGLNYWLR